MLKTRIKGILSRIKDDDLQKWGREFFNVLEYDSERTVELDSSPQSFIKHFTPIIGHSGTQRERYFLHTVEAVHVLFQVREEEIHSSGQINLLKEDGFDKGFTKSFLFVAVKLKPDNYARGKYADMTREVSKRFGMPVCVLFRNNKYISLAFAHRRESKKPGDNSREVLGKVSLIREINEETPHRAHLDILNELSLPNLLSWMSDHNKPHNFDGLLAAWLNKLDTEELNKRFYKELFEWFVWAVSQAKFPTKEAKTLKQEEHVIRLITRVLFIWFVKEKGLIAGDLFNEAAIKSLLRNYDRNTGDSYYRAVLQNLFFATLNTEIDKRGFSKKTNPTHRNFSLYRYKREINNPERLQELFHQTPFINGGLFDCLDSEEATRDGGYRIDCFSDVHYTKLSIPNRLFFDEKHGLFTLLDHYKFTVEENTPIEQEVALDPELLGKVFENLLAAYNPETRETARKQTGSYYTPRAVVDCMVDEALVAALAQKCRPTDNDTSFWKDRLRYLLDYAVAFDDAHELFDENEAEGVVRAISEIKMLDPAVGSGAFPMAVLHKLTLVLRRIDPKNTRWEKLQKERAQRKAEEAFNIQNQPERNVELREISDTFQRYKDSDFGRKLYLIQNSIFGVDIQPVACQIAKLRFFISLAIEQKPTDDAANNYGIKPLPNLETRFVAADTLLPLNKNKSVQQLDLGENDTIIGLRQKLNTNREQHFHAATRREKLECRKTDRKRRNELATELKDIGLPASTAEKISQWDPYDQNAHAEWFDAEYMFGIADSFDIAIGNPPYIQLQKNHGEMGKRYKDAGYTTYIKSGDIYCLFYECSLKLLKESGHLCYVTSNKWMRAAYGEKLRQFFTENDKNPITLIDLGPDVFEATVDTNIFLIQRSDNQSQLKGLTLHKHDGDMCEKVSKEAIPLPHLKTKRGPWFIASEAEFELEKKIEKIGKPLKEWDISIYRGILTGYNQAFIIDNETKEALIREDPKSAEIIKPVLRGKDIKRYQAMWAKRWLIATFPALRLNIDDYPAIKKHLLSFGKEKLAQAGKTLPDGTKSRKKTNHAWYELQDTCAYHAEFKKEKIVWGNLSM